MTKKNNLLTGKPGAGKTTLIRRALEAYCGQAGGFYTQEVRVGGVRQGFEICTLQGEYGVLAHRQLASPLRVGRYGVDLAVLEALATPAVLEAVEQGWLVVVDEIGPMEMHSPAFCRATLRALDSKARVLGTIVSRSNPFCDAIKQRPDVQLVEVTNANRDRLVGEILEWVQEI